MQAIICRNCLREIFGAEIIVEGRTYCSFECMGEDLARWAEFNKFATT